MKSLLLISGGLDSCVASAIAQNETTPSLALSINYGQRHSRELKHAALIAQHFGVPHHIIDMSALGSVIAVGTALVKASEGEALPSNRSVEAMPNEIPRSYVPGRNSIMLAIAQSVAEALELDAIYCGFNAVDYSGYPDCRPEFLQKWNELAWVATKRGVEGYPISVAAPIIYDTKIAIVKRGIVLEAPLHLTWSCYAGGATPCGTCDSCLIRQQAFDEVGVDDPAPTYQAANAEVFA